MSRFNCTECGELVQDTRREVPNQLCTACEADQLGCDPLSVMILKDVARQIEPRINAMALEAFGVKPEAP